MKLKRALDELTYCSRYEPHNLLSELHSKTWTELSAGTLAKSADPDKTPQNAASDQDVYSLLKFQEVKR